MVQKKKINKDRFGEALVLLVFAFVFNLDKSESPKIFSIVSKFGFIDG